jgi:hypothetical protein
MPAMTIDLQVTGLRVITDMQRLARATNRTADAYDRLQKSMAAVTGAGNAPQALPSPANAPQALPSPANAPQVVNYNQIINSFNRQAAAATGNRGAGGTGYLSGPFQRLQKAQDNYRRALMQSNQQIIADARVALENAQRGVQRLQPKSFQQRLMELIGTTRIGNSGVAPLVNRIGALLPGGGQGGLNGGANGAMGGMLLAGGVAVAAAATQTFARWLGEASQAAAAFKHEMLTTGGTARDTAALQTFGLPGDLANALRDRLSSDPFAMATAGAQIDPRLGGSQNNAAILVREVEKLRAVYWKPGMDRAKAAEEALRRARILGIEPAMKLAAASAKLWAGMKRDLEVVAVLQERYGAGLNELEGQTNRLKQSADNAKTAIVGNAAPGAADAMAVFADLLNKFAESKEAIGAFGQALDFGLSSAGAIGQLYRFIKWVGTAGKAMGLGGAGKPDPAATATSANTQAVIDLTAAIKQQLGGGPRAGGALPPAARNDANRTAMQAAALDLRGYRL